MPELPPSAGRVPEFHFSAEAEPPAEAEHPSESSDVWIHIYHTDPYTAWLNWAGLKYAEVPIYHAGVEVYGIEWAFQYFDDAWDDETISGVICCEPKHMAGFAYQQSISLGSTNRSFAEVREILERLRSDWPASSYHLTRHNCLTFARDFVRELEVPEEFPSFLLGFSDAQRYMPRTDAIVDFGWNWYKWAVKRTPEPISNEQDLPPAGEIQTSNLKL